MPEVGSTPAHIAINAMAGSAKQRQSSRLVGTRSSLESSPKRKQGRSSVRTSWPNGESNSHSPTYPPPLTTGQTRTGCHVKGTAPGQPQQPLANIAIHPLSSSIACLITVFHDLRDMHAFSSGQAVTSLESYLGRTRTLDNVTIKPLLSNVCVLMGLIYDPGDVTSFPTGQTTTQLNSVRRYAEQPAPSLACLPAARANVIASQDDDYSSDSDSYEYDCLSSDNGDERSISAKNSPWSREDDARLFKWKKCDKPWGWICHQFPNSTPGSVRGRWYIKLRPKAELI